MGKCETCGKEVLIPFVCSYCGKQFCGEHRLPEAHNGSYLKPKTWASHEIEHRKHKTEKVIEKKLSNTLQNINIEYYQKNSQTGKWKIAVIILVIGIIAVNTYFWNGKYGFADQTSYDSGFSIGYSKGNQTGYGLGYHNGNQSGYNAGVSEGYASGYDDGYVQGVVDDAGSGYILRDPTFSEAINFISIDQTDSNKYTETYQCRHFTADVKNNAFEVGYRCGYVSIGFHDSAHAIVCFNTIDEGLIFIEPQSDDIVNVIIGQPYWDRSKYTVTFNDIIVEYDIIW